MPDPAAPPGILQPDDPTVEAVPGSASSWTSTANSSLSSPLGGPAASLVRGAGVELTGETQDLLRTRLRMAAILLCCGFAAFLVRHYFRADFSQPINVFLFSFHVAATVILGTLAAVLYRRCTLPRWWLKVSEWAIFGLPAAFFVAVQYFVTLSSCHKGVLDFPEGLWLVLIYTYALFIPNTRRRAAVAIGLMCLAPLALLLGMMWR